MWPVSTKEFWWRESVQIPPPLSQVFVVNAVSYHNFFVVAQSLIDIKRNLSFKVWLTECVHNLCVGRLQNKMLCCKHELIQVSVQS